MKNTFYHPKEQFVFVCVCVCVWEFDLAKLESIDGIFILNSPFSFTTFI